MFFELSIAILLEVQFAKYFWDLNAPDQGFPVDEATARRMFAM
jgi:hypothetical protein